VSIEVKPVQEVVMKILFRLLLSLILLWGLAGCTTHWEAQHEKTSQKYEGPVFWLESDRICAFFEVQNVKEYQELIPKIFKMPERPLCQITVADNYKMENGPTYLLSSISILVSHEASLGWYVLTMPETHELPVRRGVTLWGYPKIVRNVTLESAEDTYVGTSYEKDGKTPEFTLTLNVKKTPLESEEKQFFDFIAPIPLLTIKAGKVLRFGGGQQPVYNLEKQAPRVWKIKLGEGSVAYPNDPKNLLNRLSVGRCITGYWGNMKYRYSLAPNK
jgi:hypothetical protein